MLESAVIISFLVLSIHYTMQEGEIFGALGTWFYKHTPEKLHQPLYDCNVCMSPYYGSVLYVLIYGVNWQWPIVVITAMGINAAINKLSPDKDNEIDPSLQDSINLFSDENYKKDLAKIEKLKNIINDLSKLSAEINQKFNNP